MTKIKCNKIKYDEAPDGANLPKSMTVQASTDFIEVISQDQDELEEAIGELIEEKAGFPVLSFCYSFAK